MFWNDKKNVTYDPMQFAQSLWVHWDLLQGSAWRNAVPISVCHAAVDGTEAEPGKK